MSRENPKEGYVTLVEKAVDYLITRFESGCRFRSTVANIDFTLPDSNADANVVGCVVEIERKSFNNTVAVTGAVDKIYYRGSIVSLITLEHENDMVRLHCAAADVWLVIGILGAPTFDSGSPITPLSWDVVEYSTATTVGWTHHGKTLAAISGGDPTVVFTLPALTGADKLWIRVWQKSNDPEIDVAALSGDLFEQPNCTLATVDKLCPEARGIPNAFVELLGLGGAPGKWLITGGSAVWIDVDVATDRFVLGAMAGVNGNIVKFDANGQLKDSGVAVDHAARHLASGGDDIEFYANDFLPIVGAHDGTAPPSAVTELAPGAPATGKVNVRKFDPVSAEDVVFAWQVPANWTGEFYYRVVGWITEGTAPVANEGVAFKLSGFSVGHGDALNGAFGAAVKSAIANLAGEGVDAQFDRFLTPVSAVVTVTDLAAGETAMLKVERAVGEAEDDYAQDVGVTGIVVYYKAKLLGSAG